MLFDLVAVIKNYYLNMYVIGPSIIERDRYNLLHSGFGSLFTLRGQARPTILLYNVAVWPLSNTLTAIYLAIKWAENLNAKMPSTLSVHQPKQIILA